MYQEALACFLNDPEDKDVLATFKEARKALDKANTGGASTSPAIPMLLDTTLACEKGMGLQVAAILMRTRIACDVAKEVILHAIAHRNPRNEKGMARAKCLLRRMLREEKPIVASLGISIALSREAFGNPRAQRLSMWALQS